MKRQPWEEGERSGDGGREGGRKGGGPWIQTRRILEAVDAGWARAERSVAVETGLVSSNFQHPAWTIRARDEGYCSALGHSFPAGFDNVAHPRGEPA